VSLAVALSMVEQAAKPLARPVRVSNTSNPACYFVVEMRLHRLFLLFCDIFLEVLFLKRYGSLMLLLAKFVLEEMVKITLLNLLNSSEECLHRFAFKSYLRKQILFDTF
jgi:hypothetical protein